MARNYRTPGVYVEEVSVFPPSVAQVETAIPAFIGYTEKAQRKVDNDLRLEPFKISSMVEYRQYFGGPDPETQLDINLTEYEDGGTPPDITVNFKIVDDVRQNSKFIMYYSLQHFFNNGGGPCYIVSAGDYQQELQATELKKGLNAIEKVDEVTLILFPEAQGIDTPANYYSELISPALQQCDNLKDRFTIIEVYKSTKDYDESSFTNSQDNDGLRDSISDNLKYGAAYYPNLLTTLRYTYKESEILITAHNVIKEDGTQEAAPAQTSLQNKPLNLNQSPDTNPDDVLNLNNSIYKRIIRELELNPVILPPGPAMAGIYARIDASRGVWKAPANVGVNSVIGPILSLSKIQNDFLNIDVNSGKSVNAIRSFTGKGTKVWGARTLDGNDNEWRYIPVRRFFIMAEESIKKATERFVFEPNASITWVKVKTMIENFLLIQWRNGALAGAKPEHAFYVHIGLGETMTAQDILEGRMIVEIGMAVVRPAEFIVLRFMHKMQES